MQMFSIKCITVKLMTFCILIIIIEDFTTTQTSFKRLYHYFIHQLYAIKLHGINCSIKKQLENKTVYLNLSLSLNTIS